MFDQQYFTVGVATQLKTTEIKLESPCVSLNTSRLVRKHESYYYKHLPDVLLLCT